MAGPDLIAISNTMTYKYTPLQGAQSFRLLRILPISDMSEDVYCTTEEFDRESDQCPPYAALSYTWGQASFRKPLKLNGQLMVVTENLYEALVHLRRMIPDIVVWIDALSINQDDPAERGHQVAQMRAIYSNARRVVYDLALLQSVKRPVCRFDKFESSDLYG
jgi:hypothetical protein